MHITAAPRIVPPATRGLAIPVEYQLSEETMINGLFGDYLFIMMSADF